jgi:hypothetical protein
MKNQLKKFIQRDMLTLIIGILLGAIIATSVCLITKSSNNTPNMPMNADQKGSGDNNFKGDKPGSDNNDTSEESSESDSTKS